MAAQAKWVEGRKAEEGGPEDAVVSRCRGVAARSSKGVGAARESVVRLMSLY